MPRRNSEGVKSVREPSEPKGEAKIRSRLAKAERASVRPQQRASSPPAAGPRMREASPRRSSAPLQVVFAPGARVVIRDEEWIVRSAQQASGGGAAVRVTGLSELVRNKEAIFLTELDEIKELRSEETELVQDDSPHYRRSRLYLESLLRIWRTYWRAPATP